MSTITAVRKNGEIAIACDTLVKWGSQKNTAKHVVNHSKIIQIGDNYLAITGMAAGRHALQHFFTHHKKSSHLRNPDEIFACWQDFQKALKDEYHFEPKTEETGFESNNMDILIVNENGLFGVGAHRDVQVFSQFYAYGSGGEYALGAMASVYTNPQYTATQVAHHGIEIASEFDDGTALPIISYVVKEI